MKTIEGEDYLTPQEAASLLGVHYKTVQRWSESGGRYAWVNGNGNGNRKKEWRAVSIPVRFTRTGYRLYRRQSIEQLLQELAAEEQQHKQHSHELAPAA